MRTAAARFLFDYMFICKCVCWCACVMHVDRPTSKLTGTTLPQLGTRWISVSNATTELHNGTCNKPWLKEAFTRTSPREAFTKINLTKLTWWHGMYSVQCMGMRQQCVCQVCLCCNHCVCLCHTCTMQVIKRCYEANELQYKKEDGIELWGLPPPWKYLHSCSWSVSISIDCCFSMIKRIQQGRRVSNEVQFQAFKKAMIPARSWPYRSHSSRSSMTFALTWPLRRCQRMSRNKSTCLFCLMSVVSWHACVVACLYVSSFRLPKIQIQQIKPMDPETKKKQHQNASLDLFHSLMYVWVW